jgi:hypothetical protein
VPPLGRLSREVRETGGRQSPQSQRPRAPQPRPESRGIDDRALARLADALHQHRRRGAARTRLGEDLAMLDRGAWHVERDIICNGVTMPFAVYGPHGVFAFGAGDAWAFTDLAYLDRLSRDLGAMMPGYPDPVRTGLYLPFDDCSPRAWFDGRGNGGWIVGRGRLLEFFAHFDDHGVSTGDLAVLRRHLANPAKRRRTMRRPRRPLPG